MNSKNGLSISVSSHSMMANKGAQEFFNETKWKEVNGNNPFLGSIFRILIEEGEKNAYLATPSLGIVGMRKEE